MFSFVLSILSSILKSEKSFQHFSKLPQELRMMVIDEMGDEDRISFSFTSKWCQKDASASKKYCVTALELFVFSMEHLRVYIFNGKCETDEERKDGYSLEFEKIKQEKYVKCRNLKKTKFWTQKLDSSVNLFEYGTSCFKNLLKPRNRSIKKLVICGRLTANFDFGLQSLNSIEELHIEGNADIRQFFANISHPLKSLGGKNIPIITEYEAFYHIRERLNLPDLKLTSQQLQRLSASNVRMRIGDLSERDIFDFIETWKNGRFESESGEYKWILDKRKFDLLKLYDLLGIRERRYFHHHTIRYNHDAQRTAILHVETGRFVSLVWGDNVPEWM